MVVFLLLASKPHETEIQAQTIISDKLEGCSFTYKHNWLTLFFIYTSYLYSLIKALLFPADMSLATKVALFHIG